MFDYGNKDTAAFSYFQIFLNFFILFFHRLQSYIYMRVSRFASVPSFSVVCWSWSCVPLCSSGVPCPVVCVLLVCSWIPDNHTHAHTYAHIYAHTHARARGFLDRNF